MGCGGMDWRPFVICRLLMPSKGRVAYNRACQTQPTAQTSTRSQMNCFVYRSTSSGARYMAVQQFAISSSARRIC